MKRGFFYSLNSDTMKRQSKKGCRFTSDYIEYSQATLKGNELLWDEKRMIIGFYVIFAINTGLRVSDILARKHNELANLKTGDYLRIIEKKTRKFREIQINTKIIEAYSYIASKLIERGSYNLEGYIFTSQKECVYRTESLNTILKRVFSGYAKNISTHSLRKSFGRHVYDANLKSEHSLICLSEIFQHTSMKVTRCYLGLRKEEIGNIYMNL